MSILKLGKVRPTPKGAWTASSTYEAMDWVTHKGLAYQALINVPANKEPDTSPAYWMQTGMKGEKGDKGEPGVQGPAGTNGRDGAQGVQGPAGLPPQHQWTGSKLAFKNTDGTWGSATDLRGPQGVQGVQGPQGATPQLSDAVNSTLGTVAASSNAVKTAYDKATMACVPLTDLIGPGVNNTMAAPRPHQPTADYDTTLGAVRQQVNTNGCLPAGGSWYYFALGIITHAAVGNGYVITALSTGVAAGGTRVIDIPANVTPWITCWRIT